MDKQTVTMTITRDQLAVLKLVTDYSYGMVKDMWRDQQLEGRLTQDVVDDMLINYGVLVGKLDELG